MNLAYLRRPKRTSPLPECANGLLGVQYDLDITGLKYEPVEGKRSLCWRVVGVVGVDGEAKELVLQSEGASLGGDVRRELGALPCKKGRRGAQTGHEGDL